MKCPNCGKTIPDATDYCAYCGTGTRRPGPPAGPPVDGIAKRTLVALTVMIVGAVVVVGVVGLWAARAWGPPPSPVAQGTEEAAGPTQGAPVAQGTEEAASPTQGASPTSSPTTSPTVTTPTRTATPSVAPAWRSIGLEGENVTSVDFAPGVIYASTSGDYHGIFKLTEGSWVAINNGLGSLDVYNLDVAGNNPEVLFAGTVDGFWRSANGGNAWSPLPPHGPYRGAEPRWRIFAPRDDLVYATVYANLRQYLVRGSIEGLEEVGSLKYPVRVAIAPANPSILYAFTGGYLSAGDPDGMFRSADGALSWQRVANVGQSYWVRAMCVDVSNSDFVYAGTGEVDWFYGWTGDGWGIYRSEDGGWSWLPINTTLPDQGHGIGAKALLCDPVRPLTAYVVLTRQPGRYASSAEEEIGIYMTDDGGDNWAEVSTNVATTINSLSIDPSDPLTLYAATTDGIWTFDLSVLD